MKTYVVEFSGVHPVGACALVEANNPSDAIARFMKSWAREYPAHDPTPLSVSEPQGDDNGVMIIMDGDY